MAEVISIFSKMPEGGWQLVAFLIIAVAGILGNIRLIKAEIGKDLAMFKNDIRKDIGIAGTTQNKIDEKIKTVEIAMALFGEHMADCKANSNAVDELLQTLETEYQRDISAIKESLSNLPDYSQVSAVLEELKRGLSEMRETLEDHNQTLQEYANYKTFRRKIRHIFVDATRNFSGNNISIAAEYLCFVCEVILKFVATVEKEGLDSVTPQSLMATINTGLTDCQAKFLELYPADLANKYFKDELSVFRYQDDLLKILEDKNTANHIHGRYVSATIRWCQELCANFMNVVVINRGEK